MLTDTTCIEFNCVIIRGRVLSLIGYVQIASSPGPFPVFLNQHAMLKSCEWASTEMRRGYNVYTTQLVGVSVCIRMCCVGHTIYSMATYWLLYIQLQVGKLRRNRHLARGSVFHTFIQTSVYWDTPPPIHTYTHEAEFTNLLYSTNCLY